jgi:hypothetical protein
MRDDVVVPPLLADALEAMVPLFILELRTSTVGDRLILAGHCGQQVASHGDDILYRSAKPGRSARAVTALAKGLACAAYQPGGVQFGHLHWCTDHEQCVSAAGTPTRAAGPGWSGEQAEGKVT